MSFCHTLQKITELACERNQESNDGQIKNFAGGIKVEGHGYQTRDGYASNESCPSLFGLILGASFGPPIARPER